MKQTFSFVWLSEGIANKSAKKFEFVFFLHTLCYENVQTSEKEKPQNNVAQIKESYSVNLKPKLSLNSFDRVGEYSG